MTEGVSANGLYYQLSGAGDETVVFIHGFSMDHRTWNPQVDALLTRTAGRRILRYDQRGHGRSTAIDGEYEAQADLAALLDELGIASANVVGLSSGARIAVDFALTYPKRVNRLVLAGPWVSGYVAAEAPEGFQPVIDAVRAGDLVLAAERFAETPLMTLPNAPSADSLVRDMVVGNASLWGLAGNPERPLDPPAVDRLGELNVPVLVIVGARDTRDVHRVAALLQDGAPTVSVREIEDAGHLVNLEQPTAFNAELIAFLARPITSYRN